MTPSPPESLAHRRGRRTAAGIYYAITVGFIVIASANVLLQAFGQGPAIARTAGTGCP